MSQCKLDTNRYVEQNHKILFRKQVGDIPAPCHICYMGCCLVTIQLGNRVSSY